MQLASLSCAAKMAGLCFALAAGAAGNVVALAASSPPTAENGYPAIGLGCASGVRTQHMAHAMQLGFRAFDTAQAYQWGYQEHELGEAWQASSIPRSELFLQTKVHPDDLIRLAEVFPASLKNLRTDYVDSLLMHRPGPGWRDAWVAMEGLVQDGKAKHIGVSNFDAPLLRELLDSVSKAVKPTVVQNWMGRTRLLALRSIAALNHAVLGR